MTQLSSRESMICGMAIGICNVATLIEGDGYWIDATKEEMETLLGKLQAIQEEEDEESDAQ